MSKMSEEQDSVRWPGIEHIEPIDRATLDRARRILSGYRIFRGCCLTTAALWLLWTWSCGGFVRAFGCRSHMNEAKGNIRAIYALQLEFKERHHRYARSLEELGWRAAGRTRYRYLLEGTNDRFEAIAYRVFPSAGAQGNKASKPQDADYFRITHEGRPKMMDHGSCEDAAPDW